MKYGKFVLSIVAVLAISSSANAAVQAWFQLAGSSDPAVTVEGEGAGQTLVLSKPAGPGTTTLDIGLWISTDSTNITGHSTRLLRSDDSVTWGGFDKDAGLGWLTNDATISSNAGDILASNFGQAPLTFAGDAPVTSAQGAVLSGILTITITKADSSEGVTDLFAAIGNNLYAGQSAVSFGPNGPVNGLQLGAGTLAGLGDALPSISIRNIPEPATLSLLGLGAIALIRRRR